MNVRELREMLDGVDDNMQVLIPEGEYFNGFFISPCKEESGIIDMALDENLLSKEASFVLVPCGFFNEHEVDINLN